MDDIQTPPIVTPDGVSRSTTTYPLVLLLAPFAFGAGLLAAGGWFGSSMFGTQLDLQTRVMAAVCIASIVAMTLVATGHPAGGVLSAVLGIGGIVGAIALVGGGGDDVSTRLLPALLAALSLSLIALAIRWVRERPIHFDWIDFGGLSLAIGAIAVAVAMG